MHKDYGYRSAILILVTWLIFGTLFVKEASGNTDRGNPSNVLVFRVGDIPAVPKPINGPTQKDFEKAKIAFEQREKEKAALPKKKLTKKQQNNSSITFKSGVYQCVVYARKITGNPEVKGTAKNIVPNTQVPAVGAVVLTKESLPGTYTGHAAVVVAVTGDSIVLEEANYFRGGKTNVSVGRTLPLDSPLIRGYLVQ